MLVKKTVLNQKRKIVNDASKVLSNLLPNPVGWITIVREALGMTDAQLANRQEVTRDRIRKIEKAELSGSVTIRTMNKIAEAMNCRFVYAIVPEHSIEALIDDQARKKAAKLIERTNVQMALEDQSLDKKQLTDSFNALVQELVSNQPKDFWAD